MPSYARSFRVLTSLFFMWGFITVMNDVLNNTFLEMFNLSKTESSLVQVFFFFGYFVVSLLYFIISSKRGDPINKLGYKNAMVLGLVIAGIGSLLFYPAAQAESFPFFLGCLFVLSSGITILQIAANPFAAIMGPEERSTMRLNLAQGFNSLGTTIGPIVGVILIFIVFSDGDKSPMSLGKTYLVYGAAFFVLAALVWRSKLPDYKNAEASASGKEVFKFRHLTLGIVAIFCYVGAEVAVGNWVGKLIQQPDIAGLNEQDANMYLAFFWGGLMIGRLCGAVAMGSHSYKHYINALLPFAIFFFIYLMTSIQHDGGQFHLEFRDLADLQVYLGLIVLFYIALRVSKGSPSGSLSLFAVINIILLAIGIFASGETAMWSIMGVGLFCSVMWSNIFTLAIKNLGIYTSQGSSLLVMAIVGGAVFPFVQGVVADSSDVQTSFFVPLAGFVYLIYYGLSGYKTVDDV